MIVHDHPGRYVAFEGIEGAGKSTIARHVAERLSDRGVDVVLVREPGGTEVGEGIRRLLLDAPVAMSPWTEALLFAAARAQLAAEVVAPALQRGAWVLSDRTVYSSLAYQGGARRLGVETVRAVNEAGLDGVWPDLVVLLRLDPAEGLARQDGADRIGSEDLPFHGEVADTFAALARLEPDRFVVVDADQGIEEAVATVVAALDERGVGR